MSSLADDDHKFEFLSKISKKKKESQKSNSNLSDFSSNSKFLQIKNIQAAPRKSVSLGENDKIIE